MIKFQQRQALTSHLRSVWSIVYSTRTKIDMIEKLQFWLKKDKVGNTECMSVSQQHPATLLQILQDIAVFGAKKGQFLF